MRRIPTRSKVLWIGWLAYFLVFEIAAIRDPAEGDTLSESVWVTLHHYPVLAIPLLALLVWLAIHFLAPRLERRIWDALKYRGGRVND